MAKIDVTEEDIREGIQEDCDCCPIANAATRVTGQDCRVVSVDLELHLNVGHQYMPLPWHARRFVMDFDDSESDEKDESGRAALPNVLPEALKPFSFEIPAFDDPAWKEKCNDCESLFAPAELDNEGHCEDCTKGEPTDER